MKPAPFKYYAPASLAEALEILAELGYDGKILAGGQSLIATLNFRMSQPLAMVDLNNIPQLFYIRPDAAGGVSMGSMTRSVTVEHDKLVAERVPLVHEAMPFVAHPQIRNRGTFGGAVAHADPAGQAPSLVLALNAKIQIKKKSAERWVDAVDFFMGPFTSVLEPDEILTEIIFPSLPPRSGTSYKHVARQSGATSLVGCATVLTLDDKGRCAVAKMVLQTVGMTPFDAVQAAKVVVGQTPSEELFKAAAEAASKEVDPGTDMHATEEYRRHLAGVLVRQTLSDATQRARAGGKK
jgi:aerobic carbon-monoxide dehydrogenase medium subunit